MEQTIFLKNFSNFWLRNYFCLWFFKKSQLLIEICRLRLVFESVWGQWNTIRLEMAYAAGHPGGIKLAWVIFISVSPAESTDES